MCICELGYGVGAENHGFTSLDKEPLQLISSQPGKANE